MRADIVMGLQQGDESKGKVTAALCSRQDPLSSYDCVLRFNGGPNAGHTIFLHGQKVVTHAVPTGVIYGIPSVIGPGCVIEPKKLLEEVAEIEATLETSIRHLVKIDERVHLIREEHRDEDALTDKVGSTKRGIMPAYRDKHSRVGLLARRLKHDEGWKDSGIEIVDVNDYLQDNWNVLCEGAQGFYLDIDWGQYPYISNHCLPGMVNTAGVPIKSIDKIYGVAKAYETYVGTLEFEPGFDYYAGTFDVHSPFALLRTIGGEFGATTGRPRQCNWLNLERLEDAVRLCSCTHLIISKIDVLEELAEDSDVCCIGYNNKVHTFSSIDGFKNFVEDFIRGFNPELKVVWSGSPHRI